MNWKCCLQLVQQALKFTDCNVTFRTFSWVDSYLGEGLQCFFPSVKLAASAVQAWAILNTRILCSTILSCRYMTTLLIKTSPKIIPHWDETNGDAMTQRDIVCHRDDVGLENNFTENSQQCPTYIVTTLCDLDTS